jgi:hypothetical protein
MDIDCGGYFKSNLLNAINDGSVSNATVNQALYHLFRVQMRLGLFDPADKQPYMQIPTSAVNTTAHQQLALEDSRQGAVCNNLLTIQILMLYGCRHDVVGKQQPAPTIGRRSSVQCGCHWSKRCTYQACTASPTALNQL